MRAASALFVAGIFALSVSHQHPHEIFHYEYFTSYRRSMDSCQICYGDDCAAMNPTRCDYYVEVDEIIEKAEDGGVISAVDGMLYDLAENVMMSEKSLLCVPLISQYTDCNKENLCTGCRVCKCDNAANWICQETQLCQAEPEIDVDHGVLTKVMGMLETMKHKRRKRSIIKYTDKSKKDSVSLFDIAEWMYGVTPIVDIYKPSDVNTEANKDFVKQAEHLIEPSTNLSKPNDPEYLGFEEVLNNIAIKDQTYKRRKPQLKERNNTVYDINDLEEHKITNSNASDLFMNFLNDIEEGKDIIDSSDDSNFMVDLFPRVNKTDYSTGIYRDTLYKNSNIDNEEKNTVYTLNDKVKIETGNIVKRDVSQASDLINSTETTSVTTTIYDTATDKENNLENSVLIPLANIIEDKENEIKELLLIKNDLMRYMNLTNHTEPYITNSKKINASSTYFSFYKLDLLPEIHANLRRSNGNVIEKLLYKLKRDIYEVFRDIAKIQKLSRTRSLPDDLKMLIRSMKYYVNKQGSFLNFKIREIKLEENLSGTRKFSNWGADTESYVQSQLYNILTTLDKSESVSQLHNNALTSLSKSARKIMKRVIKQNYVDELSINFKAFDAEYNLTNYLKSVGQSWPQMTANIATCSTHDKLYAMKLLHLDLSKDIIKIKHAISIIAFTHSRRMVTIDTQVAKDLMDKISNSLDSIKNKVQTLIQHQAARTKNKQGENAVFPNKKKKESFLNKLRNMLRSSKNDIVDMAKNNIPKSEIFQTIANKKLSKLTLKKLSEDEHTMLKWQKNLKIPQRTRRDIISQLSQIKNRIIIPKYLRGKISPAIAQNWKSKKTVAKKKTRKQKNLATTVKTTTKHTTSSQLQSSRGK